MANESVPVVHVAGPVIIFNGRQRQRCSWCGATIVDDDLTAMAWSLNEDGTDPGPPGGFQMDAFVSIDGDLSSFSVRAVVEPAESKEHPGEFVVPERACMRLDPEVTI